jgi:Predicted amidohydrolase
MRNLTLAFGQTNPVVGDFNHNLAQIQEQISHTPNNVDLLIFGELAICGYPLGDLSYRRDIIDQSEAALASLADYTKAFPELTIVVGHASHATSGRDSQQSSFAIAHNSASVIRAGR